MPHSESECDLAPLGAPERDVNPLLSPPPTAQVLCDAIMAKLQTVLSQSEYARRYSKLLENARIESTNQSISNDGASGRSGRKRKKVPAKYVDSDLMAE
jgi:hypothetical protein